MLTLFLGGIVEGVDENIGVKEVSILNPAPDDTLQGAKEAIKG